MNNPSPPAPLGATPTFESWESLAKRLDKELAEHKDANAQLVQQNEKLKQAQTLADKPMLVDVAAAAIWEQHMNKLRPEDQTDWNDAPPLGRGITFAYAKSALMAIDAATLALNPTHP